MKVVKTPGALYFSAFSITRSQTRDRISGLSMGSCPLALNALHS